MIRAVALAVVLVVGGALVAGCQIDTRSEDLRCAAPTDCADGRTCVSGWCVSGGDPGPDADPDAPDAVDCPAGCDECVDGTCVIRCATASACPSEVVCPADLPCAVDCSGEGACGGGIDCSMATACTIACTAPGACGGGTACGEGPCDVRCTAMDSCAGIIDCDASCACDVECSGAGACAAASNCPGPAPCDTGAGCSSQGGPCSSC